MFDSETEGQLPSASLWSLLVLHYLSQAAFSVWPTCLWALKNTPQSLGVLTILVTSQGIARALQDTIECPEKGLLWAPTASLTYLLTKSSAIHWEPNFLPRSLPRNIREDHHLLITKPDVSL